MHTIGLPFSFWEAKVLRILGSGCALGIFLFIPGESSSHNGYGVENRIILIMNLSS